MEPWNPIGEKKPQLVTLDLDAALRDVSLGTMIGFLFRWTIASVIVSFVVLGPLWLGAMLLLR